MYSSTDSERVNGNSNTHFSVYKSLSGYNKVNQGDVHGPPVSARIPSMSLQVVPEYHNQMGYHALTHNISPEQMNSGHYTVKTAYPNYLSKCDTFQPRVCNKMIQPKNMGGMIIQEAEILANDTGMTGMTGMTGAVEYYGCSSKKSEKYRNR